MVCSALDSEMRPHIDLAADERPNVQIVDIEYVRDGPEALHELACVGTEGRTRHQHVRRLAHRAHRRPHHEDGESKGADRVGTVPVRDALRVCRRERKQSVSAHLCTTWMVV
jgi:hypothetical protein